MICVLVETIGDLAQSIYGRLISVQQYAHPGQLGPLLKFWLGNLIRQFFIHLSKVQVDHISTLLSTTMSAFDHCNATSFEIIVLLWCTYKSSTA